MSLGNILALEPQTGTSIASISIANPGSSFQVSTFYNALLLYGSNNIVGLTPAQAKLGILANNGGPTQTILPMAGSVALCAISPSTATGTDQRGRPRSVVYGSTTCQDAGSVQTSF